MLADYAQIELRVLAYISKEYCFGLVPDITQWESSEADNKQFCLLNDAFSCFLCNTTITEGQEKSLLNGRMACANNCNWLPCTTYQDLICAIIQSVETEVLLISLAFEDGEVTVSFDPDPSKWLLFGTNLVHIKQDLTSILHKFTGVPIYTEMKYRVMTEIHNTFFDLISNNSLRFKEVRVIF